MNPLRASRPQTSFNHVVDPEFPGSLDELYKLTGHWKATGSYGFVCSIAQIEVGIFDVLSSNVESHIFCYIICIDEVRRIIIRYNSIIM